MNDHSRRPVCHGSGQWSEMLACHQRWLRTVIQSRLRNLHATDEVMQEVACAALERPWGTLSLEKIPAWLYRVAIRQALLYRRREGRMARRVRQLADRRSAPEAAGGATPLDWMLADERERLVREAVDRLDRRDRELLMLKYTEQWTCREVAEHLGASESTIQTRLLRARARLRRELERPSANGECP